MCGDFSETLLPSIESAPVVPEHHRHDVSSARNPHLTTLVALLGEQGCGNQEQGDENRYACREYGFVVIDTRHWIDHLALRVPLSARGDVNVPKPQKPYK
jgi:hypothetical protein